MFGNMQIESVLEVSTKANVKVAVGELLALTDHVRIARWIQFPAALFLFLVEDDRNAGAFYLLDRKTAMWYSIDFEDEQFGGYTIENCQQLVSDCKFLSLVERPGLLRSGLQWTLMVGETPVVLA